MRDFDIRILLKSTQLQEFRNTDSIIVEELDVCCTGARVDIAVINCSLHAFEIKSDQDTLTRLPGQIRGYTKVFDYINVICGNKHLKKIESLVPNCVGLYLCTSNGIVQNRPAQPNIETESFFIAKLLWKSEIHKLLNEYNIKYSKGLRNWLLCELLAKEIEKPVLAKAVRQTLKQRTDWKLTSRAGLRFFESDDCVQS